MNQRIVVVLIFMVFIMSSTITNAYDNVDTHRRITKTAVSAASQLDNYLMHNLGFAKGYEDKTNGKMIIEWLQEGSYGEDEPNCRASNHFHNPLLPWDQSYMSDDSSGESAIIRAYCSSMGWTYANRKSNISWATGYLAPPPNGQKASFNQNPDYAPYNWDKARQYYYDYLTATNPRSRELSFGVSLLTLGHVIHLLQDMAVPAHTRNDFQSHLFKLNNKYFDRYQPYEKYVAINPDLVRNADPAYNFPTFTNTRLTDFWDTDQYNGSNPSTLTNIGLAEFSNANYLSNFTIPNNSPTPEHIFPYPSIGNSNTSGPSYQICDDYEPNFPIKRKYVSRKDKGSCPPLSGERKADHFALVSLLNENTLITNDNISNLDIWIDDNVHKTYATELLPRAVGYSAGLIDYFFRGNIEITLPQSAIYAFTGSRETGFTRITLNAKNTTGNNEEMPDGSIELVARYRTVQQDPFQPYDLQASNDYVYAVAPEAGGKRTISRTSSVELVFDRGTTAIIPANAVDISLQVIYRGRLGNEDGAVAVGLRGISDPTPVERMNNMDKVCLNGAWYNAGSSQAIAQVDSNSDGIPEWDIYQHNLKDAYVKISTSGNPVAASSTQYTYYMASINAGFISRAFILADAEGGIKHSHAVTVEKTTTLDTFTHANNNFNGIWTGQALKSQVEYSDNKDICSSYGFINPCAIRHAPPFYQFRGSYIWGPTAVIMDNPEYPVGQKCQWELLQ